ncbi:uncharacterized protein YbjT (DUF2867 family) [Saccharopolyspora lacisalsi]|uniref:Uncharacterized protein YbjT (DUF2867 family) n=1 Tax=Halosaccharopolyspora lacisalsi TaxID=1000566 RepID=A0A839E3H9_9PSEU|nr:NAD(P)H-binding protein [Halosaccharopolyspora lacisalsi]MBA8827419.1 uncharacterized protein YbjT (DUF2867 family) [Halosaccharopolyspora lacisalsi]
MGPVLVTGATGTLGRPVLQQLLAGGADVRALSRREQPPSEDVDWVRADLAEPAGSDGVLGGALEGVSTVVHCASDPLGGDVDAARNLIAAARDAGVSHLVYISIVGVDRVPFPYYRTKYEVEQLLENSDLGVTILRATQFHDLVLGVMRGLSRLPLVPVPSGVDDQPVEVTEVAERLARLALGDPAGRVPDLGGPLVHTFAELLVLYQRASGVRRRALPFRLPGRTFRAFAEGGHLAPEHADGAVTFRDFLAHRLP